MAKLDIDSILKKTATGFKSDVKDYTLSELESILYGLKIAIDSADNDEKMENKITSFIDTIEKQIKKLSDIKKKNGVSAEDASANLASILGFGVKPQAPKNAGRVHTLDGTKPKKSITSIPTKITPTPAVVVNTPALVEAAAPKQPAAKPPKPNKTSKSGQFLLFGFEPKGGESQQENESQQSVEFKNDKQMSLDFNKKVKKEKSKSPSEALLLRARAISLKESQLEETKRRHMESEKLEREHLAVRNKESLRINQREKDSSRVRLEVANLDLEKARLKTEAVKELQEKKYKTAKSIQTSKARALLKKEEIKAESADKRAEVAKEVKLAQLKYKEERDAQKRKDAEARKLERENLRKNKLKGARRDKIGNFLHEMSPTVGYSYKLATAGAGMFGKTGGITKDTSTGSNAVDGLWKAFFASGAGSAIIPKIGSAIMKPLGMLKGGAMGLGKGILKGAATFPGIAGIVSAVAEYSGGASLGKALTVGAGAMAGVAVGAAAGAFLGPAGMLIGGMLGGMLGEYGAREIFNMLSGKLDSSTTRPLPSQQQQPFDVMSRLGGSSPTGDSYQVSGSAKGSEKEQEYLKYFMGKGYSKEAAAGIVGNLVHESGGLNPNAVGDNGQAFGLAQWNRKGSPDRYNEFSKLFGKDLTKATEQEQLDFIAHELENKYKGVGSQLKQQGISANDATMIFSDKYERPNARYARNDVRVQNSNRIVAQSPVGNPVSNRREIAEQRKMEADKVGKSAPQPVSIINGGSNVGGNTTNTTIINAPETDSLIRQMSYLNMKTMAPAQ